MVDQNAGLGARKFVQWLIRTLVLDQWLIRTLVLDPFMEKHFK